MNIALLKKKLRENIHVMLRTQAALHAGDAPARVRDQFLSHFKDLPLSTIISGTVAIKHELNMRPLMEALSIKGHMLCLPVITAKGAPLLFRAWRNGDAMFHGQWNIQEPKPEQPECVPTIVLCPFLAFDRAGRRLGYGGGYFDATLRALRMRGLVKAVGIGYAAQEVEAVPVGATDQPLDLIITEKEVITPEAAAI